MATCHSGYSSVGRASDCRLCRNQMVPGSIPGGRIALLSHPPATSTGSDCSVLFVSLVSCLSVPLSAEGSEGSTLENVGRDDLGGFCTPILLSCSCQKNRSKSSRPLWGAANDYKKDSCSLWPHAIPAIAQLVEHLTVDCAEIRWSLARFWVAGLPCSLILLPPPQAAIVLCCLSALYLACPYRCLQRARRAVLWKMWGGMI